MTSHQCNFVMVLWIFMTQDIYRIYHCCATRLSCNLYNKFHINQKSTITILWRFGECDVFKKYSGVQNYWARTGCYNFSMVLCPCFNTSKINRFPLHRIKWMNRRFCSEVIAGGIWSIWRWLDRRRSFSFHLLYIHVQYIIHK